MSLASLAIVHGAVHHRKSPLARPQRLYMDDVSIAAMSLLVASRLNLGGAVNGLFNNLGLGVISNPVGVYTAVVVHILHLYAIDYVKGNSRKSLKDHIVDEGLEALLVIVPSFILLPYIQRVLGGGGSLDFDFSSIVLFYLASIAVRNL